MDFTYNELINDLLDQGDVASAQAALRHKMDAGDGMAYALFGIYVYTGMFADYGQETAFDFWEKGTALGDLNSKGFSFLKQAKLYLEEDDIVVLEINNKPAKQMLKCAAEGGVYIYEFLLKWIVRDGFSLAINERLLVRIIVEGLSWFKKLNPEFLARNAFKLFYILNRIEHTDQDWAKLYHAYKDLLTEEYPMACYCVVAEFVCFHPDMAKPKVLYQYLSCIKESMPEEYHCLMCAIKDMRLCMNEAIAHAEEANRLSDSSGLGRAVYAYCLMKGMGIQKDLFAVERLLAHDDSSQALSMLAHCRMFIDPEHPDIEGAMKLLDKAKETGNLYYDKMFYLLYAESKGTLTEPLKRRLANEMADAEKNFSKVYWLLKGVQEALSKEPNDEVVATCFTKSELSLLPVVCLWLCGQSACTDYNLLLAELVHDEDIDTDMRYHVAFRLLINCLLKGDRDEALEAFAWADNLGGARYGRRNHFYWTASQYFSTQSQKMRKLLIDRFLVEYESLSEEELKREGIAHYLRVVIEVDRPRPTLKRLKAFVKRTVDAQDSYAMICVGHILMRMKEPDLVQWGTEIERMGLEISPFCRMDWIIEALTGGMLTSQFI